METGAVHPLALLTRDGWIHVLARLDKPRDWWNVANCHPLFLSIFQSHFTEKWISAMFLACVPHLLNYLPFRNVLELRLVDQEIRSTIDQSLEQGQVSASKNFRNEIELHADILIPNEHGQGFSLDIPPIRRWMNLHLECLHSHVLEQAFVDFLPFFRQYGPQVYKINTLIFKYNGQPEHTLEQMASLRNLLVSMPNLEVLQLAGSPTVSEEVVPHSCSVDLLTVFLGDNPLPHLPLLNTLYLYLKEWPQCEASAISGAFLQCYGCQLRRIASLETPAILHKGMSRLRDLVFHLETYEQLANLQACGAPLKGLLVAIAENSPISPSKVLLALQSFQTTLIELNLIATHWEFSQLEQVPAEWPHVEVLKLEGGFSDYTGNDLSFLTSFRNLKVLLLSIVHSGEIDLSSGYSQLLEEEHFYKASIWKRLPNLQEVRITAKNRPREHNNTITRTFRRDTWSTTRNAKSSAPSKVPCSRRQILPIFSWFLPLVLLVLLLLFVNFLNLAS